MITSEDTINTTYSITVTCTIHPDSTVDQCVVMARADGQTLTGEHIMYIYLVVATYLLDKYVTIVLTLQRLLNPIRNLLQLSTLENSM